MADYAFGFLFCHCYDILVLYGYIRIQDLDSKWAKYVRSIHLCLVVLNMGGT